MNQKIETPPRTKTIPADGTLSQDRGQTRPRDCAKVREIYIVAKTGGMPQHPIIAGRSIAGGKERQERGQGTKLNSGIHGARLTDAIYIRWSRYGSSSSQRTVKLGDDESPHFQYQRPPDKDDAGTRQRRTMSISDNLASWLSIAPKTSRPAPSCNEDVCGERPKNIYSERRDGKGSVIRKAIVSAWPHNALRHSFGSYHYAKHRDENSTAAEMGNSPGVVFRHYRALVKPEAASSFWKLLPDQAANVIGFAA